MGKYLKLFSTESDYQIFRGGTEWITPNVSYIEENGSVSFEPKLELLTFTVSGLIEDREFTFEKGMTWEEWIDSEYNIEIPVSKYDTDTLRKFKKEGPYVVFYGYNITNLDGEFIKLNDKIMATDHWYTK